MARQKKTAKKGKGQQDTTAYGTRLTARQRQLIEEAAQVLDCSSAKFIRDAAVRRAADVVNASGEARTQLKALTLKLLDHILNPEVAKLGKEGGCTAVKSALYHPGLATKANVVSMGEDPNEEWVERGQDYKSLRQVREVLETCGTEFIQVFLAEWEEYGKGVGDYSAKIRVSEILSGSEK